MKKLGILGGGLMGAGIAYVATAVENVAVRIKDKDDEGIARALSHVQGLYSSARVRREASVSLGVLQLKEAGPPLIRALADPDKGGAEPSGHGAGSPCQARRSGPHRPGAAPPP